MKLLYFTSPASGPYTVLSTLVAEAPRSDVTAGDETQQVDQQTFNREVCSSNLDRVEAYSDFYISSRKLAYLERDHCNFRTNPHLVLITCLLI